MIIDGCGIEIPKYTVIQYIRKKGVPIGVLAAVKSSESPGFNVGYSLCNKKAGDRFNKARALQIALGRASVVSMFVETDKEPLSKIPSIVGKNLPSFFDRCKKYYKV